MKLETFYLPHPYSERLDELDADGATLADVQAALASQKNVTLNQVAAPATGGLAASTGSAGNITGSTSYQITFVTANGETELSPISTIAGPVAGQIQLTAIPTGPAGVTARKIYRTNPAQGPEPRYLTTLNDNTTTTYLDNTPAASVTELPLNINTTGGIIYNDDIIVFAADKAVTIVGYGSGATNATANNVFIGKFVAPNQGVGYWNTGVGDFTLNAIDDGYENTATGVHALGSCVNGKYNTATGVNAGRYGTAGSDNCLYGYASGLQTQGTSNCLYGVYSGQEIVTAESVCAFGIRAGTFLADGVTAHTSCSAGVYLGADTKSGSNGSSNEIVIGATAIGQGSNTAVIGNTSITRTILRGTVEASSVKVEHPTLSGQVGQIEFQRKGGSRLAYIGNDSDATNQFGFNNELNGGFNFTSSSGSATSRFNHNVSFRGDSIVLDKINVGGVGLNVGAAGNTGYLAFFFPNSTTRLGYIGYATTTGARNIDFVNEFAGGFSFNNQILGAASSTTRASLRIPHGTAPTSPENGDMWTTTAGLYIRINGSTIGPLS